MKRIGLLLGLFLVSCGNNPFPEATFSDIDSTKKPQTFPAIGLTFPSVMEFTEGQEGIYEFLATVPKGRPVLSVEGLPAGAELDQVTNRIRWTPSFTAGNNPQKPQEDSMVYPIRIVLYGSEDPSSVVTRDASILVRDVQRPLLVWTTENNQLSEGTAFAQSFVLASEDLVESEVKVYSNDLPRGAVIEKDRQDPLKYWIRYTPSFRDVTNRDGKDGQGFFKALTFNLHALAPGKRAGQKVVNWKIRDVRKAVLPVGSQEVVSTGDVIFTVGAMDQNGELPPAIRLLTKPAMGSVSVDSVRNPEEPNFGMVSVRWNDIPRAAYQKSHQFQFQICSIGIDGSQTNCIERKVQVRLDGSNRKSPTIDRTDWALGEVKELVEGSVLQVRLPIVDGNSNRPVDTVEVKANPRCSASWSAGVLSVTGISVGYCQIDVTAVSDFGLAGKESLLLKVNAKPEVPGNPENPSPPRPLYSESMQSEVVQ
jgi:hypothetical protein